MYSKFKDNIWAVELSEMGSLSSNKRRVKYILYVVDAFIKCFWNNPLTDKRTIIFHYGFIS